MLVIRLSKTGKKGEAKYRIVVNERRSRRDGNYVDSIGWYEKTEAGEKKQINKERLNHWLSKGARPSLTVEKLIK